MAAPAHFMWCPREDWGSRSDFGGRRVRTPVPTVFIHHSVTPASADPCKDARAIEAIGIARFGRMSYTALVHPSGIVLEGAGEFVGAHTEGRNSTSLGLCFIGNLSTTGITREAIESAVHTINLWRALGAVERHPQVLPHSAVKSTACPGGAAPWIPLIRTKVDGHA